MSHLISLYKSDENRIFRYLSKSYNKIKNNEKTHSKTIDSRNY